VIVAQTLYSSTKDHINEFATLRAIGSSGTYIHKVIVFQALLSAVIGFGVAAGIGWIIVGATARFGAPGHHDPGAPRRPVRAHRRHVRAVGDRGHRSGDADRSRDGLHAMTEAILDAADVVKFLGRGAGRVEALKGVSLTVTGGELTLLMGPSGSGKTTLLSILG